MFHAAVRQALTEDVPDPGQSAGELMISLATNPGLDYPHSVNLYRCVINHAAIADLVVTAIRQNGERWVPLEFPCGQANGWNTSALMSPDGSHLRRFLAVSHWSDDRESYERMSWYVYGEIAHFGMPMQMAVAVIGPMTGGRRHSHWAKALLHPSHSELRFRLRRRSKVEGFAESWQVVYREEHDEIARERWLASMHMDEVLNESLFVVNIPVPEESERATIRELAKRQLERLHAITALPEKQLTTCNNPLHPCPFRACCWSQPESRPEDGGFDEL